jgi:hypothetical protein
MDFFSSQLYSYGLGGLEEFEFGGYQNREEKRGGNERK